MLFKKPVVEVGGINIRGMVVVGGLAALVALDAKTGEILAMVGGRGNSEFNRATQAKRAPGSTIKPFVYLFGINSEYL